MKEVKIGLGHHPWHDWSLASTEQLSHVLLLPPRSPSSSALHPATWATRRAGSSPRSWGSARMLWCSSTRSTKPTQTSSPSCCSSLTRWVRVLEGRVCSGAGRKVTAGAGDVLEPRWDARDQCSLPKNV